MLKSALSAAAVLLTLAAMPASAHSYKSRNISIDHPWSRATPKGAQVGAGYLSIENTGAADRLISAKCACSATTEIHIMKREGDIIQMHHLPDGLALPAKDTTELQPGGAHLMFIGLKYQLETEQSFKVRLEFERAGVIDVRFKVAPLRRRK
jgi:copper(I)-binding protein